MNASAVVLVDRPVQAASAATGIADDPAAAAQASALRILDDPLEQGRFTRWVSGEAGQRLGESTFQLAGLVCGACGGLIETALMQVPGVSAAQVNVASERATVRWDPLQVRPAALISAVRRAGYWAVPDAAASVRALRQQEHRRALWRLFVAAFCAMQVMMLATPSYVAAPGELTGDLRQLLNWGGWVLSLPVMVFAAGPFFAGAWRAVRSRRIGMDVPVSLALAITFVASTGATFTPGGLWGQEVYFDSLTMFVSFLLGVRYLELRARQQAAQTLESSLARLPDLAWRVGADGVAEAVSVMRLSVGDLVRVPVGQAFAADGVVEQGQTQAVVALLTGESVPVAKQVGDDVVAGSVILGAPVLLRLLRVGHDTRLEAMVSMMRSALAQRPAAVQLADRWAGPFLWTVLMMAALAAAAWSVVDPSRALWVAVSVLIVTCPCALSLAVPATWVAAARGLAQRGVLLQRLQALEVLATATHFFFDKTGTLTQDKLALRSVVVAPEGQACWGHDAAAQTQALAVAAGLAAWSSHPLSQALVQAAGDGPGGAGGAQGVWSEVQEVPGQGSSAVDSAGVTWRLGRAEWVAPSVVAAQTHPSAASLHFGPAGHIWASFELEEALRPGTEQALADLQAQGLRLTLLTGDQLPRAQALAQRVGLHEVLAAATPEAKLAAIVAAQAQGAQVVMVGDGINDAPVLARADASLAMGQGAFVARSQADAVITSNHLADLVLARRSAKKAMAIVRQNLVWAAAYNAVCIPLALLGYLPPWAAGLGMATSSLAVVLNALRAAR